MKITVIIPTLSRSRIVSRLLGSLTQQGRLPDQIIIVDASSDDNTQKVVQDVDERLKDRIEYYKTKKGLTHQRNFGIERAKGDIVGFFDDDVVPDSDYFEEIEKQFNDKHVGAISGYVYEDNLNIIKSPWLKYYMKISDCLWGKRFFSGVYNMAIPPHKPFEDNKEIRCMSGCNMFFRSEVIDKYKFAQWFEGYSYFEDVEFGLRISRQWKIIVAGKARLHHFHESSGRDDCRKTATMSVYNPVRILTVARDDRIVLCAISIITRRMAEVAVASLSMLVRGDVYNSCRNLWGGIEGVSKGIAYIAGLLKKGRRGCLEE